MLETKMNKKRCVFSILILSLIIFQSVVLLYTQINKQAISNHDPNTSLQSQTFSEDDYNSILQEARSGLGTISILNISFTEKGFINYTSEFPNLDNDITQEALNVSFLGTRFNKSLLNASRNYLKENYIDQNILSIYINESLEVVFDNDSDTIDGLCGYMVYLPRLTPIEIEKVFVNNTELEDEDYSIENEYIKFNYLNYGGNLVGHFSMDIFYSYNITLIEWRIAQLNEEDIVLKEKSQNISADYNYRFKLNALKYIGAFPFLRAVADNLEVSFQVSPFDMENLTDFKLTLKGEEVSNISDYIDYRNDIKISLSDSFRGDSVFLFEFSTNFTVKFLKPVGYTWAIDRLVGESDTRERIYFPSVINGPQHIVVQFSIEEPSITSLQVKDFYSQFGRSVNLFSDPEGFINITTPRLIKGEEACPFMIKYRAEKSLKLIITDTLNMPLIGVEVRIYYQGKLFGTYISQETVQPIGPLSTNQNGEISIKNIPIGNYTIKVYQYGMHQATRIVSTESNVHYIKTDIIHIPVLIIIFGSISAIIFILGILLYLRNNKEKNST
ncbi:MAG: hypothetical protein EU541_02480 [Promethearchaeota archaeon]|nr:MAG: hypothetical protein EU541_02480 [Candidatus Lokiarchaeota archaeon]